MNPKYKYLIAIITGLALIGLGQYGESLRPWIPQIERMDMPVEFHWYGVVEWMGWIVFLLSLFGGYHNNQESK